MLRRILAPLQHNGRPVAAAAALAAAVVLAACGGQATSGSSTPVLPGGAPTSTSAASSTASRPGGAGPRHHHHRHRRMRAREAAVGTAQRVDAGGSKLQVAVVRLLDPLRASGAATPPGTRAIGVQVTIRNLAGATYDSSASGDLGVLTSGGPASPLFVRRGVCQTPLVDFESLIGVGEERSGCVGFSVARGARVLSIQFSPHSRAQGRVAWR